MSDTPKCVVDEDGRYVPDPQPLVSEASEDELRAHLRAATDLVMGAEKMIPGFTQTWSAIIIGDVEEARRERDEALAWYRDSHGEKLAALARVRELEEALPLLRSELDWCIGYAATGAHEAWRSRLVKQLYVVRALLGSGEEQEPGA